MGKLIKLFYSLLAAAPVILAAGVGAVVAVGIAAWFGALLGAAASFSVFLALLALIAFAQEHADKE